MTCRPTRCGRWPASAASRPAPRRWAWPWETACAPASKIIYGSTTAAPSKPAMPSWSSVLLRWPRPRAVRWPVRVTCVPGWACGSCHERTGHLWRQQHRLGLVRLRTGLRPAHRPGGDPLARTGRPAQRVAALAAHGMPPTIIALDQFVPQPGQQYLLGPTTPTRAVLAQLLEQRFGLEFCTLVHPTAYVSPLATLGPGVFVGANSAIGPGAKLAAHVFVNRGVTIGHDTRIAAFARVQPGANVGGLGEIGAGATIGIGATVIERVVIGAGAYVGAGAVVTADVAPHVLVVGVPAKFKKNLEP